jgi:membrane protease YdiL (CAAX protease family)
MYDSNSKGLSYTAGFFILIGFVVAGLLLSGLISIPIWTNMTGISFEKMGEEMDNPANADAFKVIQCITAVIGFFLPAVLTAFLLNRKPMTLLGYSGKPRLPQVLLVFVIMFFGLWVSSGLSYFNSHLPISQALKHQFDKMENDYNSGVESIISLNNFGEYLFALFILALLPAICEETLFRGGFQNFLTRATKMPWLSIIIVSILFSLAHWSYYGFLSRFFLGIMLGLLYQYSGKIWLNILGHFLNNAIAITVLYYFTLQGKSLKDAINDNTESYVGIVALPIVIGLLYWFWQVSKKDKALLTESPPPPVQNIPGTPGDIFPS